MVPLGSLRSYMFVFPKELYMALKYSNKNENEVFFRLYGSPISDNWVTSLNK